MSKAATRFCLPAIFLLALAACSGTGQTPSVSVAGTAADAPLATENTAAPEKPQAPRGGTGIQVASLPIGGSGPDSAAPDGVRCLTANWSPSSDSATLSQGYAVVVTAVEVPSEYTQTEDACPGPPPPCRGHIFRPSDRSCVISIRSTDARQTELGSESADVSMKGEVLCPVQSSAGCQRFADSVRRDTRRVRVTLPVAPDTPQPAPDSTTGSPTNAPPQATSTTPGG